jgi:hypothetical protein
MGFNQDQVTDEHRKMAAEIAYDMGVAYAAAEELGKNAGAAAERELAYRLGHFEAVTKELSPPDLAAAAERATAYMIVFDDKDRDPEIIFGESSARAAFASVSLNWNAHLFVMIESNSPVESQHAQQPTYADLAKQLAEARAECERLRTLLLKARPLIVQKFDVSKPWVVNEIDAALAAPGKSQ